MLTSAALRFSFEARKCVVLDHDPASRSAPPKAAPARGVLRDHQKDRSLNAA
jgi:hypothetical protein